MSVDPWFKPFASNLSDLIQSNQLIQSTTNITFNSLDLIAIIHSLSWLPIVTNWFRNHAIARALKKSSRKSRAVKRNEMSTKMASKFEHVSRPLIRMRAWSSRNCMTSQTCTQRKHALTFLVSVKIPILHDIDA